MNYLGLIVTTALFAICACNGGDETTNDHPSPPGHIEPHPQWPMFPDAFEVVLMRGNAPDPAVEGNSLDAFEATLDQGINAVEVDFLTNRDGVLIAAHHDELSGGCGRVSEQSLEELRDCRLSGDRRVATLSDLLQFEFDRIYIDLKSSAQRSPGQLLELVSQTIDRIEEFERLDDAIIMLYDVDDEVAAQIEARGARAGLKGYPSDPEAVKEMIDRTEEHGLEMMCIKASNLTPALVEQSTRQGVWQLPWDHARESNISHWKSLSAAGIGGLIVDTDAIVTDEVIEAWRDPRQGDDDAH